MRPGRDAYNLVIATLKKNAQCMAQFKVSCPLSFQVIVSQITFDTPDRCADDDVTPCGIVFNPANPITGTKCEVNHHICFSVKVKDACDGSVGSRADLLLFEVMNYCDCKYHNKSDEKSATQGEKAMQIPSERMETRRRWREEPGPLVAARMSLRCHLPLRAPAALACYTNQH